MKTRYPYEHAVAVLISKTSDKTINYKTVIEIITTIALALDLPPHELAIKIAEATNHSVSEQNNIMYVLVYKDIELNAWGESVEVL